MAHMAADSHEELVAMAIIIGVPLKHIQHEGTYREHFDVCLTKRASAIRAKAKPVTTRQLVQVMRSKLAK